MKIYHNNTWRRKWLLPAAIFVALVLLGPFLLFIYHSLRDFNPFEGRNNFIGLANFTKLLSDKTFIRSVYVTCLYGLGASILSILSGLLVAWIVFYERSKRFLMATLIAPFFVAPVVFALIFLLALDGDLGFAHRILSILGVSAPREILSRTDRTLITCILIDAWQWTGPVAIGFLARLRAIPTELLDVVSSSGGGKVRRFFDVWLPQMASTIIVFLIFRFLWCLADGEKIDVLTAGGSPFGAMQVISIWLTRIYFRAGELGYGSAAGLLFYLLVLGGATAFVLAATKRRIT